jgi:hypothetical protein
MRSIIALAFIMLCSPALAAQDPEQCVAPVAFFQKIDDSPDYSTANVVPLSPQQVARLVELYNANKQPAIQADAAFLVQLVDNAGEPAPKVLIGLFHQNCLQGVVAMPFAQTPEIGI